MKVVNVGSINIDHVYEVEHFVRPGETLSGESYKVFAGGKGYNQSVALSRAGATTLHAGRVGREAENFLRRLQEGGVDIANVKMTDDPTGHAIIQVTPAGENAIVLFGGANQKVSAGDIEQALSLCSRGDYLLVQNETSSVGAAIQLAHERGLRTVFNPAPMTDAVQTYPLELVDLFVLNEIEAEGLTGTTDIEQIKQRMIEKYPNSATVLTLGSKGALYFDARGHVYQASALNVKAVDTTGAGDTFIGYFLAGLIGSGDPETALKSACRAAAVCVTRAGASDSIPMRSELDCYQLPSMKQAS